ncbi:Glycoside hydrolase family 1 [Dillenia turbinata]|uniref:Glycoside hydrolase family 1 n=1 Tax=Dillenia turbinata TaxID=194707 RepID=A0AAN8UWC2_9MAGN
MWLRKDTGVTIVVLVIFGIQTCHSEINRASFPKGFVFGTASSAYQYEGAVKEDGREDSIWDTFAHTSGKIIDSSNADVAVDQYHLFNEDVQLMKDMGMDAYRFSIAWSRIFPDGTGKINPAGVDYYNNLIDALLAKGSLDFVGINHYTTNYAFDNSSNPLGELGDSGTATLPFKDGKAIGDRANSIWLYIVPRGIRSLMNYIKQKYGNPLVIITENGMDDPNNALTPIKDALKDEKRIHYHNDYLTNLLDAIKQDGCNVKGYFAWSLLDNWEWAAGYTSRFGLYFVDYNNNLTRYAKDSARWFKKFLLN